MNAQMTQAQLASLDWAKGDGLLPAVVQHAQTGKVLMLGYMNAAALNLTIEQQRVTFFSRSKNRLWTKGETSGNFLHVVTVAADCDNDSLLVQALPDGPTCHTGSESCFGAAATASTGFGFLDTLEAVIAQRIAAKPEGSYTARLWSEGPTRLAQKVGEEGVEVALAAVTQSDEHLVGEAADLIFHLALLLKNRNLSLAHVMRELERRHAAKP